MLNKQSGNMYGFVTHTWNPIKGECIHKCNYCYITKMNQRYKKKPVESYLDEKCFKDNLGKGNYIFVGSSCDLLAENIKDEWIKRVLHYCNVYPENTYLIQTKNPSRFSDEMFDICGYNFIFCTTLETNRTEWDLDKPTISIRYNAIKHLNNRVMITIEPIMDFDVLEFRDMIYKIEPFQVNIGADSGNNKLNEPSPEKVNMLIKELKKLKINVFIKDNLKRLLKGV